MAAIRRKNRRWIPIYTILLDERAVIELIIIYEQTKVNSSKSLIILLLYYIFVRARTNTKQPRVMYVRLIRSDSCNLK